MKKSRLVDINYEDDDSPELAEDQRGPRRLFEQFGFVEVSHPRDEIFMELRL